jgi:phosphate transport system permease protein
MTKNVVYYGVLAFFSLLAVAALVYIILYVMAKGLPHISWEFLSGRPRLMGRKGGIFPVIVGTLYVTFIALLIATPVGVGGAIYFTEYAGSGRLVRVIRTLTEVLAGVPSIIFGLFGFAFFVVFLGMGWSVLSGGLTLAMMILPTMIRSTEEGLKAVPRSYREGSLALGADKWRTTALVVLPCCKKSILTGVILGVGRATGETAALFLTIGGALKLPVSPLDSARTMSLHMYTLTSEGISEEMSYATAALLIIIILVINSLANFIASGRKGKY